MKKQTLFMGIITTILITLGIITLVTILPIPGLQKLKKLERSQKTENCDSEVHSDKEEFRQTSKNKSSEAVVNVKTAQQVKKMARSKQPIVMKFYSNWCGACMAAKAVYPSLAKKFTNKVTFYAINVEEEDIVAKMKKAGLLKEPVEAIPTFVFFEDGQVKDILRGFPGEDGLAAQVKEKFNL